MPEERLKATLSSVLKIDKEAISDESSPNTIPSWDSMNALMLVTALESEFHVKFTAADIVGVKNVGDIKKSLERHGISF